jgi:hypothetical protein
MLGHVWGKERRGAYRGLLEKPWGKGTLGRSRHMWEHNTKLNLKQTEARTWTKTDLAWDRVKLQAVVNLVTNPWIP